MQFEYIDDNLTKIMQNPDSVLYLRPYIIGNKVALFAMVKEKQGIYRKLQITKEQSKLSFPFEPISCFHKGPGYFYLKKYIIFHNWIALNTTNLNSFRYENLDKNKIYNIGIIAIFNDGSATYVKRERLKNFQNQGEIKPYVDLLKQHKEYEPINDIYEIIEYNKEIDDTFIIPKLQKKQEEQIKVKKLIKDIEKHV